MNKLHLLRSFALGIVPGMIGHEYAQTKVFKQMSKEVRRGLRDSSKTNYSDETKYYTCLLKAGIFDVISYAGAVAGIENLRENGDYVFAYCATFAFSLIRWFTYNEFRFRSDEARNGVAFTLDMKVER